MSRFAYASLSFVLIAACGEVKSRPDASDDVDATPGEIDAGLDPVRVTVYEDGAPEVGVDVVFYDPAGNVVDQRLTGGDGTASSTVAHGGAVLVLQIDSSGRRTASLIADVSPGDDLIVGSREPAFSNTRVGSLTVNWPTSGVPAGATSFQIDIGCTGTGAPDTMAPITLDVYDHCLRQGSDVTIVALAFDDAGTMLAFSTQRDVALTGSPLAGTANLPAWRTDFARLSLTATNTPPGVSIVDGQIDLIANGMSYYFDRPPPAMPMAGGSATFDFAFAKEFAESGQYGVFVGHGAPAMPAGVQIWLTKTASLPTSATVDLTNDLIPNVSVAQATLVGEQIVFEWSSDAPQTEADGLYLQTFWSDGAGNESRFMALAAPDSQSPYEIPAIPASLSAWAPPAGAPLTPQVLFVDIDTLAGYDALRTGYGVSLLASDLPPGEYVIRATLGGAFD